MRVSLAALALVAAFLVAELAAGGLHYGGEPAPKACVERESVPGRGIDPTAQRFALKALDEVSCRLGKSREQLVLDLAESGIDAVELERDLRRRLNELLDRLKSLLGFWLAG